jgi:hypothetical protein
MKTTCRKFTSKFKVQVAIEAIRKPENTSSTLFVMGVESNMM